MNKDVILCGDNSSILSTFPDECIDLTVTSPPYDDMTEDFIPIPKRGMRKYNGYVWDFKRLAGELYRVTKPGGVVVWVVNDPTIDGSESLASSLQKIYFRRVGFNIETMIYKQDGTGAKGSVNYYWQAFEYMLILSKGAPKTHNLIRDKKNLKAGSIMGSNSKYKDIGARMRINNRGKAKTQKNGIRENVWQYHAGQNGDDPGDHPAPFPEDLAKDHILSWSNPGDIVLDPFIGSGTTAKKAKELGRYFIGIDVSPEYCKLAEKRIAATSPPLFVMEEDPESAPPSPSNLTLFD